VGDDIGAETGTPPAGASAPGARRWSGPPMRSSGSQANPLPSRPRSPPPL